jgi:hypothetical protein
LEFNLLPLPISYKHVLFYMEVIVEASKFKSKSFPQDMTLRNPCCCGLMNGLEGQWGIGGGGGSY